MDFTPIIFSSFWSAPSWAGFGITLVIAATISTGFLLIGSKSRKRRDAGLAFAIAGCVGAMACITTVAVTNIQEIGRSDEAKAEVVETLSSTYGTDITVDELEFYSGLRYPKEKPKEDFEVFGSVERDAEKAGGGFERQTIYLIWQDDELRLAESADGEVFDVLGD